MLGTEENTEEDKEDDVDLQLVLETQEVLYDVCKGSPGNFGSVFISVK